LSNVLQVDSVWVNSSSVAFAQLPGHELRIFSPLLAGQPYISVVFYQGKPMQGSGLGGFYLGNRQGIPEIWTLSQPFAAADWWPTKNTLTDKADSVEMEFFYDSLFQVAAPGLLTETTPGRSVWKHRHPIPAYLVAFALTNYDTSSMPVSACSDTILFSVYRFPEGNANPNAQALMVQEGLDLFCEWLGPYPYADEKYGHAQFSRGGGMEHPTISFGQFWVGTYLARTCTPLVWQHGNLRKLVGHLAERRLCYLFIGHGYRKNEWTSVAWLETKSAGRCF
jgi:aminopeptidase N